MHSFKFLSILAVVLTGSKAFLFWGEGTRQAAVGDIDPECENKARAGDCEFYTCFDARHPCSEHNFALSYGLRYCTRFQAKYDRFNAEGQRWITGSSNCTMHALLRFYRREHIICVDLEEDMKEAHSECEQNNGVCDSDMLWDNKEALMDVYKISRRGLYRFLRFVHQCGGGGINRLIEWAKEQSALLGPFFRNFRKLFD